MRMGGDRVVDFWQEGRISVRIWSRDRVGVVVVGNRKGEEGQGEAIGFGENKSAKPFDRRGGGACTPESGNVERFIDGERFEGMRVKKTTLDKAKVGKGDDVRRNLTDVVRFTGGEGFHGWDDCKGVFAGNMEMEKVHG
ncbi:hypothetical protein L6452_03329 [Arctium lappa]|uniref:Uncharacterized protein n=1 Tax=Arctium lappa TaxID=4217 RepID=A0ACB9FNI3_ARCLA|nr:hypothetical protein L6452_03329 [Arctium lappa]